MMAYGSPGGFVLGAGGPGSIDEVRGLG